MFLTSTCLGNYKMDGNSSVSIILCFHRWEHDGFCFSFAIFHISRQMFRAGHGSIDIVATNKHCMCKCCVTYLSNSWATRTIFLKNGNCESSIFDKIELIQVTPNGPGEAASSPQHGPRVNAQMMTSLPSPLPSPPYPWLIESVQPKLAPKGYQFTSQALRVLTRVLILLPLVKVFHFCL